MTNTHILGPNQLTWLRNNLIKDGVRIFDLFEKTPVVLLNEATRKIIEESRRDMTCAI